MLRILKSLEAVCTWCRKAGHCYEVKAEDGTIAGDYCQKCLRQWIDARSGYEPKAKKDAGKTDGELAKV